jgi:hypothetical protein
LAALQSSLAKYPAQLASWVRALAGTIAVGTAGSVLLVDLPIPLPLTAGTFLPLVTAYNWAGHSLLDLASADYKRLWIEPGLGIPLAPFQDLGAQAVVFIVDSSAAALKGGYLPFTHGFEPLPALYVDRDTGTRLRTLAGDAPRARLTLTATRKRVPTTSVTAVLPGTSRETLIFNTHTDGQGFAEENAGVAFVHLARYFASRPTAARLRRTLVFAAWPGHMTADLPQTQGWIKSHPDLVNRAAAALTIEHLGCTEWVDSAEAGYHATGEPEMFAIWTTQGRLFELTRDTIVKHNVPRAVLLRPPVQFGVGGAFQSAAVPQIGAIAGPEYLLTVAPNGDLDKLDERLAARQIAWIADLATELDRVPAADLRGGDPTLGAPSVTGGGTPSPSRMVTCPLSPASDYTIRAGCLLIDYDGVVPGLGGVLLAVRAAQGTVHGVRIELRLKHDLVASVSLRRVGTGTRRIVVRARRHHRFNRGSYTLIVRADGRLLARRTVPALVRENDGVSRS